jgi:hypothetical protein
MAAIRSPDLGDQAGNCVSELVIVTHQTANGVSCPSAAVIGSHCVI